MFSGLPEVEEPEFTRWFEKNGRQSPYGATLFRMAPEQYIIHGLYARTTGRSLMADAADNGPEAVEASNRFIASNFTVAEYRDTGFRLPKYPASVDETKIGAEFFELWNKLTFERAYREFCDPEHEITAKDEAELYLRRSQIAAKLRLVKHWERLTSPKSVLSIIEEIAVLPVVAVKYLLAHLY